MSENKFMLVVVLNTLCFLKYCDLELKNKQEVCDVSHFLLGSVAPHWRINAYFSLAGQPLTYAPDAGWIYIS